MRICSMLHTKASYDIVKILCIHGDIFIYLVSGTLIGFINICFIYAFYNVHGHENLSPFLIFLLAQFDYHLIMHEIAFIFISKITKCFYQSHIVMYSNFFQKKYLYQL